MLSPKAHGPEPAPSRWSQPEFATLTEPRSFTSRARRARDLDSLWPELLTEAAQTVDPRRRALIVIPTLNEAAGVQNIIDRVLADEALEAPLVVVADGGSVDGTRDIVREIAQENPHVRLIHNPGRLQSAGLNLAAELASVGRGWLVRVDAHADYPENYVSTLIAEARRTGATSVVVSMETVGEAPFQRAVAAAQNSVLGAGGSPHRRTCEGRWVDHGHHALIDLAAFEVIGGYDESFSHNEDAEFDVRLTQHGGRIWLTDKARIRYYPRRTPQALWRQYFSYGDGRARTVLKHDRPLKFRQALPLAVAPAALGAVLSPLAPVLMLPAVLWLMTCLSFGLALAIRQRDAAVVLSGPAAAIMHLAWSAGFWSQLVTQASQRLAGDMSEPPRQAAS